MKNGNNWKLERAKEIVRLLLSGIQDESGEMRQLNILDYYKIINISPRTLYTNTYDDLREEFSDLELKKFYSFVLKSLNDKKLTVKDIMDVKHSVLINDTLVEVTDDDKINVISFLRANRMPLTNDVYALALRDYLSAKYSVDKEKNNACFR
ncbi:MAG: hypothetical protein IJL74_03920 [Bacilli bacterium]|nr:hypothetical protein [Bacilli bacterium]